MVVSRDHGVCLAAEHAERRRSPSTTKIGDATAEGAKSRMEQSGNKIFFDDSRTVVRSALLVNLIWHTTLRSLVNWLSDIPRAPTIHNAKKHLEGSQEGDSKLVAATSSSPGPRSPSPRRSPSKRSRPKSPSRSSPRGARRRVSFAEGEDDSPPPVSDESDVDNSDHTSPRVNTASAACSGEGGRAPELSSELFDSLERADDLIMQQLGSFLSASLAETADLRKRLAASEERARINQMVRDYEEHGVSTFHHDRWQMAHVFNQIILPHIVDRSTRVYLENLDWGEAEPEELGRTFSLLIEIAKSHKNGIFRRKLRTPISPALRRELSSTDKMYYKRSSWRRTRSWCRCILTSLRYLRYSSMLLWMHFDHLMVLVSLPKSCSRSANSRSKTSLLSRSSTSAKHRSTPS